MTAHEWRELKSRFGDRSYRVFHCVSPNELIISLDALLFKRNGISSIEINVPTNIPLNRRLTWLS